MQDSADWDASWLASVARGDTRPDLAILGGHVLAVHTGDWLAADVLIGGSRIAAVVPREHHERSDYGATRTIEADGQFVVPGYIDAHVHVESSKLTLDRFAATVVPRGTTCVVAEPHEIASVLGVEGTRWFMDSADGLPLDCWFMVPSCVPASRFESPHGPIDLAGMEQLLEHPRAIGVGELMNFPGIIAGDPQELAKVRARGASHADGHAPGVTGRQLDAYAAAGIRSDHESTTWQEALEKRQRGMWVLLREASNARNLRDLLPLVFEYGTDMCAFCTDDREPDFLLREGHIDQMLRIAVDEGIDPADALRMATLGPALAHGLTDVGALVPGARANVLVLDDLRDFVPEHVLVGGRLVASHGELRVPCDAWAPSSVRGTVHIAPLDDQSLRVAAAGHGGSADSALVRVIGAREGQLLTDSLEVHLPVVNGEVLPDAELGIAKMAVIERHHATGRVGLGFVHGFALEAGAFASTVAHDHHDIVVVGMDDASMRACAERLAEIGGGIAVAVDGAVVGELPLPVAGLMSDRPAAEVAAAMDRLHDELEDLGVSIEAPFMVLSFLALSVIPSLKLTDRGYVDVDAFDLVDLHVRGTGSGHHVPRSR